MLLKPDLLGRGCSWDDTRGEKSTVDEPRRVRVSGQIKRGVSTMHNLDIRLDNASDNAAAREAAILQEP